MAEISDSNRTYMLGDPELEVLGSREKLAQWRHRNVGPAFIRIGRRIAYHGTDLNSWINSRRINPNNEAA